MNDPKEANVSPADLQELIRKELEDGGTAPPRPSRSTAPKSLKPEVQQALDSWLDSLKADLDSSR